MKKTIAIAALVMCMILSSCDRQTVAKEADKHNGTEESMFVELEAADSWIIVYHRTTKVMYAVSDGSYNYGTFTLLVNADGSPMLYEEEGQ